MGKASRWLVNFLLGRKEDKGRRKNISTSFEEGSVMTTPCATPSATPFKRRWSFGKLVSKGKAHKSSRSLDSMTATPLVKQAVLDLENRHDNTRVLAMTMASATKRKTKATYAASLVSKAVEDAAATRIQAAFRSYLARKALHALRGLVKLQALVRGHLVRKQTTATLRSMHALMAIQVRARFQRIQMAEESQLAVKSQSSRYGRFHQEMGFKRAQRVSLSSYNSIQSPIALQEKLVRYNAPNSTTNDQCYVHIQEAVNINLYEKHGIVKSQNGFMNHSQIERIERGVTRYYSGELSILKREQKHEEFSFTTHNSPRHSPSKPKPTSGRSSFSSHEYPCTPNYMANTQSSRAKVRSQSEPKQRPTMNFKAKGKRTASAEEMNDNIQQYSSSQSKGVADENQEPWFVKLYQSTITPNENEGTDTSVPTSYSEYRKSLVTNEVSRVHCSRFKFPFFFSSK
ncbi:protein IQ-DOMAIN 14-like [Durio zibethinus]|uniref:Protein IQ-DOMAIN 14-like n=1 Tax=Durio zibethinus TaxID=66656 RepID=A0A6P5WVP4_DURZI|nr:protein IQ-DOMAIN 14-like [Durio zibethinus]